MNYLLSGQETERLLFRQVREDDFDAWLHFFTSENSVKYLDLDPLLPKRDLCQIWFDKVFHRYENNLGGMNALIDKKTKRLVGQCGLLIQTVEHTQRLEIGYSILPEFWSQGFATEAVITCKNYAFEHNFADSLISMIHVDNIGSEKVALKNGMAFEKRLSSVNIFRIDRETWNYKPGPHPSRF